MMNIGERLSDKPCAKRRRHRPKSRFWWWRWDRMRARRERELRTVLTRCGIPCEHLRFGQIMDRLRDAWAMDLEPRTINCRCALIPIEYHIEHGTYADIEHRPNALARFICFLRYKWRWQTWTW